MKQVADALLQIGRTIRLEHKPTRRPHVPTGRFDVLDSRCEKHSYSWLVFSDPALQRETIHPQHLNIRENEIYSLALLQEGNGLLGAVRLQRPKPSIAQTVARDRADDWFVIDNQHCRRLLSLCVYGSAAHWLARRQAIITAEADPRSRMVKIASVQECIILSLMADQTLLSFLRNGKYVVRATCTQSGTCTFSWEVDLDQAIQTFGDVSLTALRQSLSCPRCKRADHHNPQPDGPGGPILSALIGRFAGRACGANDSPLETLKAVSTFPAQVAFCVCGDGHEALSRGPDATCRG